jgi:hypothetical protein
MRGNGLRVLERAAIEQIGSEACGAEGVAIDGRAEFSVPAAALDHAIAGEARKIRVPLARARGGASRRLGFLVGCGDQVDLNVSLDSSSCNFWRNMASECFDCLGLHCLQVRATPNVAEMCVLRGHSRSREV